MTSYIIKLPSKEKYLGPSKYLDAKITTTLFDTHKFKSFDEAYSFLNTTTFLDKGYEIYNVINGKLQPIKNIDQLKQQWFNREFNFD